MSRALTYTTWNILGVAGNSGVFIIECATTGRSYIGSAQDVRARIMQIRARLIKGDFPCADLQRDFNVLGHEAFQVKYLEANLPGRLTKHRNYWIEVYRIQGINLYNEQHRMM